MSWVLWLAVFYGSGGLTVPRAERFETREECETAYASFSGMFQDNLRGGYMHIKHACVEIKSPGRRPGE